MYKLKHLYYKKYNLFIFIYLEDGSYDNFV